jgi:peptidoglycan/LPS O-acetylase OafA/YrhL
MPRLGGTVFTPRLVLSATPHGRARVVPAAPVGPRERPHVTRERLGRALIGLTVGAFVLAHPAAYWGDEPGPGATAAFLTVAVAQGAVVGALLGLSHRHRRTAPWAAVVGALAAAALAWWYGFGAAVPAEAGSAVAAAAALAAATLGARVVAARAPRRRSPACSPPTTRSSAWCGSPRPRSGWPRPTPPARPVPARPRASRCSARA